MGALPAGRWDVSPREWGGLPAELRAGGPETWDLLPTSQKGAPGSGTFVGVEGRAPQGRVPSSKWGQGKSKATASP